MLGKEPLADNTNEGLEPWLLLMVAVGSLAGLAGTPKATPSLQPAGSAHGTHIQDAEACTAGGAGHAAGKPGVRALWVLAAGEPLAHAGETPHGATVALLALALSCLLAGLHQLHTGTCLHATNACLQLLWAGVEGHREPGQTALCPPPPRGPGLWEPTCPHPALTWLLGTE